ncbi:MAG: hypothetical protein U0229_21850 [Anaeromyxobacter sp.]
MRRPSVPTLACTLALALAGSACYRGEDARERKRIFSRDPDASAEAPHAAAAPAPPERAIALDADELARRLGSFEWAATVEWTVSKKGDDARRLHTTERHKLRQLATGEFEVDAVVDGGRGPGGLTGRHVIWVGGATYARGEFAPWRERPTDRGRDAKRFRDESLGVAADVLRLAGPALTVTPAGDGAALGRRAKRHALSLDRARWAPPPPARPASAGAADDDTARRLAFLEGHEPRALTGELLVDAETGAPLAVKLSASFGVRDQPQTRVDVELAAAVRAVGGAVAGVKPPKDPLPDARKPPGVAAALEAAGLKTRAQAAEADEKEPEDDEPAK